MIGCGVEVRGETRGTGGALSVRDQRVDESVAAETGQVSACENEFLGYGSAW